MTLLLYYVFKPVSKTAALLATFFNLVAMALETLRWNPSGIDIPTVLHGLYCVLIGYLVFRSAFLPRILGVLMVCAGLAWMVVLSPPLQHFLSPYDIASGFIGEGSLMLWLLLMGVHVEPWKQQASAAGGWQ